MSTPSSKLFAQEIAGREVAPGKVVGWWLGGSGFIFKTPGGAQIWIDPYLSNAVSKTFGLNRAFPPPVEASDARPDILISTHWHEDHFDPEAIPLIAGSSPRTQFVMAHSSIARAWYWGVKNERITGVGIGDKIQIRDAIIEIVPAHHESGVAGWEAPDAFGVLLKVGDLKIYHTGDTGYYTLLRDMKSRKFDVVIACINGVTGNMDAHEAAMLAWQLGASTVIPMHHELWDSNPAGDAATLDPNLFAQTYRCLGGQGKVLLPEVGAEFELKKPDANPVAGCSVAKCPVAG